MLASLLLLLVQSPPEPVFHAGTRLVEVEVVVRDRRVRPPGVEASLAYFLDSGPPFGPPGEVLKGLTRGDFTLLDQGKPQPIAVFRAGPSSEAKPVALPHGAISNRQDSRGQPVNSATAVLIDFLNTGFDYTGYERLGVTNLLRSLGETDSRVALYTLGENLHVLHDFTDNPKKLIETAAKLEQKHRPADLAAVLGDFGDLMTIDQDEASASGEAIHAQMTVKALKIIIDHLSGVPGRKNLVWMMDDPRHVPPAVMAMAQRANIVLYPVLVRLVRVEPGGPGIRQTEALAAVTGARAFFDARDLTFAVRAAEEDMTSAYVLGYYPTEDMLDGKYHQITVKLRNKELEVHYRPGYLATKVASPVPAPTLADLFEGPISSARIGLTAQTAPDARHSGWYDIRVMVDLHDVHLDHKDGHFTGAIDVSVPNPYVQHTAMTGTVAIDLPDAKFAQTLEGGLLVSVSGAEPERGEIRVVVRDKATGIAGSLRIPVAK